MKTNLMKILALVVAKTKGMKCVFFLVSLFSLLLIPQHVQALDAEYKIDGITYHVLDASDPTHITVAVWQLYDNIPNSWDSKKYNSGDTSFKLYENNTLTIPNTVMLTDDVTAYVVRIGFMTDPESAGYSSNQCKNVKKVVMGDGIETLGVYLFKENVYIEELEIGKNVSEVLVSSFFQIPNLQKFSVANGNYNFAVGDGILYVGQPGNLKELVCVPPLKDVKNNGELILNDNIEKIRANALSKNLFIKTVHIPKNCKDIDYSGFSICPYCTNITEFKVPEANNFYQANDGVLLSKDGSKLIVYPAGKKAPDDSNGRKVYTIPASVKEVAPYAFHSVQTSRIEIINTNETSKLNNFSLYNCIGLKELKIGSKLNEIGDYCFQGCSSLASFNVNQNNTHYSSKNSVLFNKDATTLICYPMAKEGEEYIVPDDTKTIDKQAFYGANKLTKITIASTVEKLGENTFRNCTALYNLVWNSSSIKRIPANCFWGCTALKEINIKESVEELGDYCFRECSSLNKVTIPQKSALKLIGTNILAGNNAALVTFEIPDDCPLDTIGNYAFINQYNLTEINIPASIKYIGEHAFEMQPDKKYENDKPIDVYKSNLKTINFHNTEGDLKNNLTIGNSAFSGVTGIRGTLSLPEWTDSIGIDAFKAWEMEKVTLPAKTTKLSPQAFKRCAKLTNIEVDTANTKFAGLGGYLCTKDLSTLYIFPMGKASKGFALLPPSLTKLGDYCLYDGGTNLTKVCVPKKVNTFGARTFGLSSDITEIAFLCDDLIEPDSVVSDLNISTFDDDKLTLNDDATDQRNGIKIYLRKKVYDDYMANHDKKAGDKYYEFYNKFEDIKCIPTIAHFDDANEDPTTETNDANYGDEYFVMGDEKAMLLSTTADVETYVVPGTININGTNHPTGIGDYAFENANQHINEVVVADGVGYVGAMAFMTTEAKRTDDNKMKPGSTTSNIKQVVFIADSPLDIATNHFNLSTDFNEFTTTDGSAQKIYVKKNSLDDYKDAGGWSAFKDQIDYKIPYTQSGTFGTFAREFDVDFSEINGVNADNPVTDDPVVIAFTGDGKYHIQGDSYYVHMTSINLGDQTGKDGTYVPAGSGVLMKKYKDANLYYQIADPGISPAFVDGNFMKGVTVRKKTIETADGVSRFYISGGKLHEMTQPKQFSNHKSYMEISNNDIPAGAKVMLNFIEPGDETETTGIENLMVDENIDDAGKVYYNLNGQRVYTPSKGIYILNGKKVIVK